VTSVLVAPYTLSYSTTTTTSQRQAQQILGVSVWINCYLLFVREAIHGSHSVVSLLFMARPL